MSHSRFVPRPARCPAPWTVLCLLCLLCLAPLAASAAPAQEALTVQLLPTGQVQRLTQVVASFSRPMRPLGAMEQAAEGSPLKVAPSLPGAYRWLDPQTLAFILDQPLTGATRLQASVAAGVRALDGAVLAQGVRVLLHTPEIEALEFAPSVDSPLGPRPELRVILNQAVDPASLAAHAFLEVAGQRLPLKAQELAQEQWRAQGSHLARVYALEAGQDLPPGQEVQVVLEPGIKPAQGQLLSQRTFHAAYRSFDTLKLIKWEQRQDAKGRLDPGASLMLEFNNPVSPRELHRRLVLEPAGKPLEEPRGTEPTRWIYLDLGLKPKSTFTLKIAAGLKDDYGTSLAQPVSLALKTGDMRPIFSLLGGKGVLEAAEKGLYPLRARNLGTIRAAALLLGPEEVVPALVAEAYLPWNRRPPRTSPDQGALWSDLNLNLPANQTVLRPLDLARLLGRSPRGGVTLLDLRADLPDERRRMREQVQRALVQVTDLGLSLKLATGQGLAWVSQLSTGQPLAGVELELRDRANRVLWRGTSDAEGLATLPSLASLAPTLDKSRAWMGPQVFLLARHQGDLAVLPSTWSNDLVYSLPTGVEYLSPEQYSPLLAHAISQLPLYQPGQTVRLAVYLRLQGPQGLTTPAPQTVRVEIKDPAGHLVGHFEQKPNAYGSLGGELSLSPQARLGQYQVAIKAGGQEITAGGFRVASFRPPEFKVGLEAPAHGLGSQVQAAGVQADYLFGAPVSGGKTQVRVEQRPQAFAPARLEGYAVGDLPLPSEDEPPSRTKALGSLEAVLDAHGRASLNLPAPKPQPGQPVEVGLEAAVSDASGLVVTGRARFTAHPAALYVGLKAPGLAQAGQPASLEIKAATFDDQPAPPCQVKLTAYREVWETVRERGPGGFYRYLAQARREKAWEQTITLPTAGGQAAFTPPEAGTYAILAEVRDQDGRANRSGTYVYAAGKGLAGWQRFDDSRLEVVAESASLSPGQSARLLIKNPFARATALISVEGLGVRRTLVRQVEGPAPMIEVPIQAADAPNVYIGVLLVRGRVASGAIAEKGGGPDLGRPQVRIGYAGIKVKDPQAGLKVSVDPGPTELRPGSQVTARVGVSGHDDQPRQCQVTFLAVDERVLSAAQGQNSYDPRATFDKPRPLTVQSADGRTQVVGQRFQGEKGDDAAGGGGLGQALRRDFHPAVFWLAQGQTDAQGHLEVSFKLPDSLTAYRLVAVAAGQGGDFGLGLATVRASRPLQMLSALPRFAVAGDKFAARVLVQNLSPRPGRTTVNLQAQGLSLAGPAEQSLDLAPGQSRPVDFAVSADQPGPASLTFRASLAGEEDAAQFKLEVLPLTNLETAAMAGGLDPAGGRGQATVPLAVPPGADPGRGGLRLVVAPSLAAALRAPAAALLDYPWDCLEQRLSKAAARAMILVHGPELGLQPASGDAAAIKATLAQVADFQHGDGGLGLWPGQRRSDMFLTAYALLAARQMQSAGAKLDDNVKKRALDYLQENLRRKAKPKPGDHSRRLSEAFSLLVLALEGRQARPALEAVLAQGQDLPPLGLAALMGAARHSQLPELAGQLITRLEASAVISAEHLHFAGVEPGGLKEVMGSSLRDNALALWVLCQAQPAYPRLDGLAAWVAARLGESQNLSTQEAVFGLWGLQAYLARSGLAAPARVRAELAGRQIMDQQFSGQAAPPVSLEVPTRQLAGGQTQQLILNAQEGWPHWSARLSFAPASPPRAPVNAGLLLARAIRPLNGQKTPATGDGVECLLTLLVSQTRHHVLVHDPYPAGLEPQNAALAEPAEDGQEEPSWQPWRFKELRQTGLLLYAPRLDPGVYTFRYTLRAVAPGVYQHRPALAEEMYAPEVMGSTPAGVLEVR
ncbi:MAG: alpha-2-macroglobulin family protein [Pseudomonadota bacterium]